MKKLINVGKIIFILTFIYYVIGWAWSWLIILLSKTDRLSVGMWNYYSNMYTKLIPEWLSFIIGLIIMAVWIYVIKVLFAKRSNILRD